MKKMSENELDELLKTAQNRTGSDTGYQPTEEFKAQFFEKAKKQKVRSRFNLYRVGIPIAASLIFWCGLFLFFLGEPKTEKLTQPKVEKLTQTPYERPICGSRADSLQKMGNVPGYLPPEPKWAPPLTLQLHGHPGTAKKAPPEPQWAPPAAAAEISESAPIAATAPSEGDPIVGFCPPSRWNTAEYKTVKERGFSSTRQAPLSTFGADVDTAGYAKVRLFLLQQNRLPIKDAVRTDEFLNYFHYNYKMPQGDADFQVSFESMDAPWAPERKLLLIGVQAKDVGDSTLPPSNFVFLIDNSGSMYESMPIVIEALENLAGKLRKRDRISIVTYGGGVQVLLDGGKGSNKAKIRKRIRSLSAEGYTPGGAGIVKAYKLAHKHFIKGGNNRIVLITDGDFNVGVSSEAELIEMVEKERRSSIYLSVFGVGYGNFKDNKLKMLANHGNGNYSYLDSVREAKRVMTSEMTGKMFTLAKDVKFQLEFNPAQVAAYRLVGYELRELADRDFNDDTKDSGEVGIGHQVTAVYELIMADAPKSVKARYLGKVDKLKYQKTAKRVGSEDILTFKLRYQKPEGADPSKLLVFEVKSLPEATENIQWASAVTEFCLLLRNSEYKGNAAYRNILDRARKYLGSDPDGKRAEFLTLVHAAKDLPQ